jgi:hypothetical protein
MPGPAAYSAQERWAEGGGTDVERMVLLCSVHHRKVHRGHRLVRREGGGVEVVPAGGPVFGPAVHSPPPAA